MSEDKPGDIPQAIWDEALADFDRLYKEDWNIASPAREGTAEAIARVVMRERDRARRIITSMRMHAQDLADEGRDPGIGAHLAVLGILELAEKRITEFAIIDDPNSPPNS